MPRSARWILVVVLLVQVVWSAPLALVFGRAYRSTPEPGLLVAAIAFGLVAVAVLVVTAVLAGRWRSAARTRRRLLETGLRVPALLVGVAFTGTRVNGRAVRKLTFESRSTGTPIRAVERTTAALPEGTPATLAYDPADPAKAVVADDLTALAAELAGRAEGRRQAWIDEMFREQGKRTSSRGASVFTTTTVHVSGADGVASDLAAHIQEASAHGLGTALDQLRAMVGDGRLTQQQFDEVERQFSGLFGRSGR
ncbi:DUF3592 domain-containing protein [Amycolatopsis sp. PS_44_ISF1]|uniref:DUF3592 domain-containing protein n=1 Tax=Amycolatopsis sp. PS_44_ISF1 TaxID=2974917 RepID=UPI0028DFD809|nr:DUF3592 domain-containing protein [Amycolatopsis sp. PS_44_ISF1]MDT8912732.1 hypothetical protein [Amycolatopsis sp. PS_44_ISF1]